MRMVCKFNIIYRSTLDSRNRDYVTQAYTMYQLYNIPVPGRRDAKVKRTPVGVYADYNNTTILELYTPCTTGGLLLSISILTVGGEQ